MWEMGDRVPSSDVLLGVRRPGWDVHMILKTARVTRQNHWPVTSQVQLSS